MSENDVPQPGIAVTVVWCPGEREWQRVQLQLAAGSTVADALAAAEGAPQDAAAVGVWGRRVKPSRVLEGGDRVELYRPLRVDPKVARRQRFNRQGARMAGLFVKKRPGGKPGY